MKRNIVVIIKKKINWDNLVAVSEKLEPYLNNILFKFLEKNAIMGDSPVDNLLFFAARVVSNWAHSPDF